MKEVDGDHLLIMGLLEAFKSMVVVAWGPGIGHNVGRKLSSTEMY